MLKLNMFPQDEFLFKTRETTTSGRRMVKFNILMVSQYFPPFMGGKELWAYHVSKELAAKGHHVTVLTTDIPFRRNPYQFENGVNIYRTRALYNIEMFYSPVVSPNLAVLRRKYQIIHIHEPSTILLSMFILKAKAVPIVATVYNDPSLFSAYGGLGRLFGIALESYYYSFFKRKLDWASHLFVLSDIQVNRSRLLPLYKDKMSVTGMGIDPSMLEYSRRLTESDNEKDEVLFVGRIDLRKGLDVLIDAMQYLPTSTLKVVGSGSDFLVSRLKRYAARKGVHVHFVGEQKQHDLWKTFREAAVICLPSTHPMKTFGTVVLESWAMRKPVVVSRMVGCSPLVEQYNGGLVVETGNVEALAGAIQTLLSSKAKARAMGENGYRRIENFSYKRMADHVEKIYLDQTK